MRGTVRTFDEIRKSIEAIYMAVDSCKMPWEVFPVYSVLSAIYKDLYTFCISDTDSEEKANLFTRFNDVYHYTNFKYAYLEVTNPVYSYSGSNDEVNKYLAEALELVYRPKGSEYGPRSPYELCGYSRLVKLSADW